MKRENKIKSTVNDLDNLLYEVLTKTTYGTADHIVIPFTLVHAFTRRY